MNKLIFITGGARSGKSIFAESLAKKIYNAINNDNKIAYIATSVVTDEEFKNRIEEHKKRRGDIFQTYEEEILLCDLINNIISNHNIIILECLTTWLGNIFYKYKNEIEISNKADYEILKLIKIIKDKNTVNINDEILNNISAINKFNIKRFLKKINKKDKYIIIISNETGSGIVPDNSQARLFRDILGNINKNIASNADLVFYTITGIPVLLKMTKE